ncbi:hypothetical protein JVX93_15725 [Mycolicibacterium boenickei]|nr:hypothetical protein JVX93_15725 [Mycolicibacterium boenickei]
MIAGFLRGAADFLDAVQAARAEQRTGFSEREAGDYLDAGGLDDGPVPDPDYLPLYAEKRCGVCGYWRGQHIGGEADYCNDAAMRCPTTFQPALADDVVDAEVHCEGCKCPTICGCGREIYGEPESPDGPTYWFHRDDDSPITLQCARIPLAEPTAEELDEMAAQRDVLYVIPDPREVSQEDLAAHVAGSIRHFRLYRAGNFEDAADDIARDLISEYRVTEK